ncbi:hypothetical protein [Nostoc sp. PCC 7524]|nr:hypothetical protein [Nostoc sp. PCC 7524]
MRKQYTFLLIKITLSYFPNAVLKAIAPLYIERSLGRGDELRLY